MVQQTQEARLATAKALTKDDVLRLIVRYEFERVGISPQFRRATLPGETEWALVTGTIGERGGGKSYSDAVLAIVDNMIYGRTCFSNMTIKCDIEVDNDTAGQYGLLKGGIVQYKSEELDKEALLKLDDRYKKSVLLIEEINVQYSNARRFMANTNVDFNEVAQQLRKLEASLLFNVIDEMFIDSQLRALSDIFIKTYDSAFDAANLQARKPRGHDFMWKVYPMSAYLRGEQGKYSVTHQALPPVCFHAGPWGGIYNSMRHQEKGIYSVSTKDKNKKLLAQIMAESSPEMVEATNHWAWLERIALKLKHDGRTELSPTELTTELGKPLSREIRAALRAYGISFNRFNQCYEIEQFAMGK